MQIHKITKSNQALLFLTIITLLSLGGCSKAVVKSDSDPNTNFGELNKFYVQKLPSDDRGINEIIAVKLNEFGFDAVSGAGAVPEGPVDAIVTYKDRWMWDFTMYMIEIYIELHDPESNYVFASGKSYRTSLVRKPPEDMVDEVFRDMFQGKVKLPNTKQGE